MAGALTRVRRSAPAGRSRASYWGWQCTCGQFGVWLGGEQAAREQAARHIAHWVPAPEQVALPA